MQAISILTYRRQRPSGVALCRLVLAVLLLSLIGTPALADIRPGSFSVSPYLGGFVFEGNQDLKHRPVFGARFGYNFTGNWGVEGIFDYVPTRYRPTDSSTNVFDYRVEGLYHFLADRKLVPFVAAGAGGMSIGSPVDKDRAVLDYGAGIKYSLTDRLALRADVRHIMAFGSVYHNLEYSVGLVFSFGGEKAAGRTVGEARPAPEAPAASAAPAAPAMAEPINLTATPVSDSRIDLAWNAAAGAGEYRIFRDGSPRSSTTATSLSDTGLTADTRYCYRVSAFDGMNRELAKSNEACATTLMSPAPKQAATAAPAPKPYELEDIHFDFDKSAIRPEAREILKRHAAWMIRNSDVILTILVEGHCDERGTAEYNMALGQRRATAAATYLTDLGVDATRIKTISYGFERPIDPRHNEEAWAKNRRAHFVVTDRGGLKQ